MALGMVQPGYGNSLYQCPEWWKTEATSDYAELLAKLTTELELVFRNSEEPSSSEEEQSNFRPKECRQERRKDWEEVLKQSVVLDVMLRQMIENGLGQQKKEPQEKPKKWKTEALDNEFHWNGIITCEEGRLKENAEVSKWCGNSEFLLENRGEGAEHFAPSGGGRQQKLPFGILCLTCETECERKAHRKQS